MHFSPELSLGSISIVVTLIGMTIGIGWRLGIVAQTLHQHAGELVRHAKRLDTYEERLVMVVGDVQRLIGRIEATQERLERVYGSGSSRRRDDPATP